MKKARAHLILSDDEPSPSGSQDAADGGADDYEGDSVILDENELIRRERRRETNRKSVCPWPLPSRVLALADLTSQAKAARVRRSDKMRTLQSDLRSKGPSKVASVALPPSCEVIASRC